MRDTTRPRGTPALIELRSVTIVDGELTLRLQDRRTPGDSSLEIQVSDENGRQRVRRFEGLNARLSTFRLSDPNERGIRADVTRLATRISDPAVTLEDLAGRITVTGDTLTMDLERLVMPGSALAVSGQVSWPRDTVLLDLDVVAH